MVREEFELLGVMVRDEDELLRGVTVRVEGVVEEELPGVILRVVVLVIGFRVTVRLEDPTVERSLRMTGFLVVILRELPLVELEFRRIILPPELPAGV